MVDESRRRKPTPALTRSRKKVAGSALPFWQRKSLSEMTVKEWESLCDGCGKCCTFTLEDEETEELYRTSVACKLFDPGTCGCRDYSKRFASVPECLKVTPDNIGELNFFPPTCAYLLVYEGRDLPDWHHLVCGDRSAVHRRGMSVLGMTISENALGDGDMEDFVIEWRDVPLPEADDEETAG